MRHIIQRCELVRKTASCARGIDNAPPVCCDRDLRDEPNTLDEHRRSIVQRVRLPRRAWLSSAEWPLRRMGGGRRVCD